MNAIKYVLQNIVGLGLGKYVNLGLLLAAVVAGTWSFTWAKVLTTENSILRATNANNELALKVADLNLKLVRDNFDAQSRILFTFYKEALDTEIELEKTKKIIDEMEREVTAAGGDHKVIEKKLNAWQRDMDECMEEASGGPPSRPENRVC